MYTLPLSLQVNDLFSVYVNAALCKYLLDTAENEISTKKQSLEKKIFCSMYRFGVGAIIFWV